MYHQQFNETPVICLQTVKWSNSSISPIGSNLSDAITPGQRGPASNDNEGIFHIPQTSKTEASLSDDFVSYPGHMLGRGGVLLFLQRCSQCILQPQPIGLVVAKQSLISTG